MTWVLPLKTYNVNYLLSVSRLPDHFYALVNGITGRDATFANPGVSLRSFVIAKCIRRENVQVSGEMLETIKVCEEFSRNTQVLASIIHHLQTYTVMVLDKIAAIPFDAKKQANFEAYRSALKEYSQAMKLSYDSFIMNQDPALDHVDITSQHGSSLKSTMIDFLELIVDIEERLE